MKFIYTPEGADPRVFDYQPGKLLNVEAEKIEELTGWSYREFGQNLMTESMKAYHALLYIFLKRSDPTLKYEQVVFSYDEIDIDYDEREVELIIEGLQRAKAEEGLSPEAQAALDGLLAERSFNVPEEPAVVDPKASSGFEQPTSGNSPISSTSDQSTSTDSLSTN